MNDDSHKAAVREYLRTGERQKAIDYLMQVYDGVDYYEAEKLLLVIESETIPSQGSNEVSNSGCSGCFSVLLKMVSIFFMLISIMLLSAAGFFYYILKNEKLELIKVEAEVVELGEIQESEQVYLMLEYEWDGESYQDLSGVSVDKNEYMVSQKITVSINPHYPDQAYLEQETSLGLFDILENKKEKKINDLTFIQLFNEIVTYIAIVPGLILLILSISLWWASNRVTSKS